MKKTTMQDIAASLGISRTTVWKVFSGQDNVSDALREKNPAPGKRTEL